MNYKVRMLTLNQTLNYKCNIQEKRNILLTVKDLNRLKHAIQTDIIQTGDTSNNILIIQVRELQNLMQRKKKKKQTTILKQRYHADLI